MTKMRIVIALAALAAAASANGTTVYDQPFDGSGNAASSQNDTNSFGNFATVYDNFSLAGATNITGVLFTGEYFNPPSQGTITGFTIGFSADAGGAPGGLLYSVHVSGTGNEAFLGSFAGNPTYTYSVTTNFSAAAATAYWLSVVPDLGFPPQWGWAFGTGGDGAGYQVFFGSGAATANDFAFGLTSDPAGIPEPASWALMIAGFGLAGAAMRRRRGMPTIV